MIEEPTIEELVLRWNDALERGESPAVAEICEDCPEMAAVLEHELLGREFARIGIVSVGEAGLIPRPNIPEGLVAGAEPVPGHRLVRRIGRGGSGDVWEASGPGGIPVAIKFVKIAEGLDASPMVRQRLIDSLRSLELIRGVRHPNILPMFGAWSRDGLLIFVMELAERTLMDRFEEATRRGASGIPRPELIAYMQQAACGIDFLNQARQASEDSQGSGVQHGDIKPQNLLLVGGCVKVGDFGQVIRPDDFGRNSGGMTLAYAPPELSEGTMSAQSDQYALAISYCLLRGGRLPFLGSPLQVMMGHFHQAPDLTMLPEDERPAVARALSKRPSDRWSDCRTFVEAIVESRAAQGPGSLDPERVRPVGQRPALLPIGLLAVASVASVAALIVTLAISGKNRQAAEPTRDPEALVVRETAWNVVPTAGPGRAVVPLVAPPAADKSAVEEAAAIDPLTSQDDVLDDSSRDPGAKSDPAIGEATHPADKAELRTVEKPDLSGSRKPDLGEVEKTLAPPLIEEAPRGEGERDFVNGLPSEPEPIARFSPPDPPRPTTVGNISLVIKPETPALPAVEAVATRLAENHPKAETGGKPIASPLPPTPRRPMVSTINVLMPSAKAELVVKGEVGKGNPDEWYGPTRVIHSPPMEHGEDYIVGSFWLDATGLPQTRSRKIRVEPGKVYEVDLRSGVPTSKEIQKTDPPEDLSQRRLVR